MDAGRFPSGISSLVSYMHDRGLRLGLYTCAGERTCKFNRTGSGGHYEQDANWFAAQHVDLVKVRRVGAQRAPLYWLNQDPARDTTAECPGRLTIVRSTAVLRACV